MSSLKTEILLVDQLIENDKKKVKQDKETEICSYSPIAFLHKYQHKVQSTEELSRKDIKDGNMDTIFCNQYAWTNSIWTDSMIEVLNKIIVNDIFTTFIVSLNIHKTDNLIKEALTDSITEHINIGNILNKYRFNFLTNKVNHTSLIDFPQIITVVDERLYGEALFHIFSQNETFSNTYKNG